MRKSKSGVESAEVDGRDGDEEDGDGGCLDQRFAIRPLHFLQLLPTGNQESDYAAALAFGASPVSVSWRAARSRGASARRAGASRLPSAPSLRRAWPSAASARRGSRAGPPGRRRPCRPPSPRSRLCHRRRGPACCAARATRRRVRLRSVSAPQLPEPGARPCAVRGSWPSGTTGSPCGPCGDHTSGSTCAARPGPASCAETCWSDSSVACTLRKPSSPRCGHLREPCFSLVRTVVTEENPGRKARG